MPATAIILECVERFKRNLVDFKTMLQREITATGQLIAKLVYNLYELIAEAITFAEWSAP